MRRTIALTLTALSLGVLTEPAAAQAPGHHWPRHIGHEYEMFSAAGNRAVRHVVWLASRELRRGASRERTMRVVARAYGRVEDRYDEAYDTAVCEDFADELDRWLVAAGYERIDAFDEFAF